MKTGKKRTAGLKKALSIAERDLTKTLDRLIDSDGPNLIKAYVRKIKALVEKHAETEAALTNSGPSKDPFEGNYRTAMTFLANPWKLWASDHLKAKHAVLNLEFATKLAHDRNKGYRDSKLIFSNVLAVFIAVRGIVVHQRGVTHNPPSALWFLNYWRTGVRFSRLNRTLFTG